MEEAFTLFRGDYTKIQEFDFHKTHKHCLVGPGIYLTNSLSVAHSYRTKGTLTSSDVNPLLFEGYAKDRFAALKNAVPQYVRNTFQAKLREAYAKGGVSKRRDVEKTLIETSYPLLVDGYHNGEITAEYQGFSRANAQGERVIKVRMAAVSDIGYVTEFAFPKTTFESQVVLIDGRIKDTQFWELMYDHKVDFGRTFSTRDEYVRGNAGSEPYVRPDQKSPSWGKGTKFRPAYANIRRVIQPYGYLGFEYNGGGYVGGYGRHRAFCIWDDDFVNEHKVRRFR